MESPLHFSPFSHVLLLVFFPSPQSTLQEPHSPHELHSRKIQIIIIIISSSSSSSSSIVVVVVVVVVVEYLFDSFKI